MKPLRTFVGYSIELLVATLLVAVSLDQARGQAPEGPLPPRPGVPVQQPPRKAQEKPSIKVKVEIVNTPVTVRDASGELVLNLGERDFRVFDNGVEQKIEHFDLGGDPLSIVILLDSSSHVEALLPAVRKTGILFTETVVGQSGEAALLSFDDMVHTLLSFTSDADKIEKAIGSLSMGTSGARLHDALSEAVGLLRRRPDNRRRVIVAVSEARDTGSEIKLGEVLREAQLANITIYSVGLSTTAAELRAPPKQTAPPSATPPGTFGTPPMPGTPQTPTSEQQRHTGLDLLGLVAWLVQRGANAAGQNQLELASVATGGMHVNTFRERSIEKALDQIGGELHAQYTLSYRPTGNEPAGYHQIKVQVTKRGLTARSRPGYYLAPAENPGQ